jgi:hypothetical protein
VNPATKALRDLEFAERAQTATNRVKKAVDQRVRDLRTAAINALEEADLAGADVPFGARTMHFSKYVFRAPHVVDREAFDKWAAEDDSEAFFEPEARIKTDVLNPLVIQRDDDGEPLPPGVTIYREDRISRTTKPSK